MTKKIIFINGKKRSGKDTTAEMLQQELLKQNKTVKVLAFADKLKDMVCEMFGISRSELDEYKNEYSDILVEDNTNYFGFGHINPYVPLTDFRTFLDTFGNKIAKSLGGDSVWADKVLEIIENSNEEYFIISDFRFPVEINVFGTENLLSPTDKPFKLITLQVQREGLPHSDLPSENALNDYVFDYVIENNSSLESLKEKVSKLSGEILKQNRSFRDLNYCERDKGNN